MAAPVLIRTAGLRKASAPATRRLSLRCPNYHSSGQTWPALRGNVQWTEPVPLTEDDGKDDGTRAFFWRLPRKIELSTATISQHGRDDAPAPFGRAAGP